MAVAALISATREAREPGVALRATFWLAGRTLVERQARLAAGAGATLIVILIETLPADLVQAVERLRAEGLEVVTARSAAEASAAVPPGYRLVLIADGFVGSRAHIERLEDAHRPALLAVTDRGFDDRFERLDGDLRWAGLALVDGDLLREAAMLPSDWDLISTLVRRALQTGVRPLPITDEREAAEIAIVEPHPRQCGGEPGQLVFALGAGASGAGDDLGNHDLVDNADADRDAGRPARRARPGGDAGRLAVGRADRAGARAAT